MLAGSRLTSVPVFPMATPCRPASARARRSRRLHPSKSGARPLRARRRGRLGLGAAGGSCSGHAGGVSLTCGQVADATTRPYPQVAQYTGHRSIDDAASFVCVKQQESDGDRD